MKYLLPKYLVTSEKYDDKNFRKEWNEAYKKYDTYLKNHKNIVPKKLLNAYYKDGFHDYVISRFNFDYYTKNNSNKLDIILGLTSPLKNQYFFIHKDVKEFSTSFETDKFFGMGNYLYSEYFLDEDNLFHHNFLFSSRADIFEMNIVCKKLFFVRIRYINIIIFSAYSFLNADLRAQLLQNEHKKKRVHICVLKICSRT